jgi:hypothetical protein
MSYGVALVQYRGDSCKVCIFDIEVEAAPSKKRAFSINKLQHGP